MIPIVTPFSGGKVDYKTLTKLIEWHIAEGSHAIVPCGTTGESATLDFNEHMKVAKAGADGALLVAPYYNKPTQEGLFQHYKKIAHDVKGFPLVLYNVPGRAAVNILPETVARLAEIKSIVGIKEATGDMKQLSKLVRLCGDAIDVYSGDDFTTFTIYALGGRGSISVTANVMPRESARMWEEWKAGNMEEARKIHYRLDPLNYALFNPIPVKTALHLMGKIKEEFRLPLSKMSDDNRRKLKKVLKSYKLV
jgi:4-hydroxy-tetrahydrodipicolinate synthase